MDPINIYFFVFASIIGIESTRIVSEKASATINPVERTFEIYQEDLFSIVMTAGDSLIVADELRQIAEFQKNTEKKTADGLTVEEIVFSRNGEQLNVTLKGRYSDPNILAKAGIHHDTTAKCRFSLMNFLDWNIRSSDAVLEENYWSWPADKTVTIVMEPFKDISEEYRQHRRSILPYWQQWLDSQPEK